MATTSEESSIQERVNKICDDLYTKGTKPTTRLLLSMLPDVSSTSTVHRYFSAWKKELEANQKSLYDKLGFSTEFTQSFMKEITRFSVEAEQRYKEQAQDANEQRDIAIDELEKCEDKLYKQNAVVAQNEREISELQNELTTVRSEAKAELQKMSELSRAALDKEKETHAAIVTELRQQLSQATEANKSLSEANESLRTDVAKAELKLENNQEYVDTVKAQNLTLVDDNKSLNKEVAALNKTLAGHESTIAGNAKLISSYETSSQDYRKQISVYESDLSSLKSTNADLSKGYAKAKEVFERANAANAELRKTVDEQSAVINKLTS